MFGYFRFFFFKQKTAYEVRISDWSSDVCSSDLTVSTAIRTGLNGSCSSIGTCYGPHRVDTDRGLAGKARKTRPHALRQRIQAFGVRAIPLLIHPVVPQHHLHIMARLHAGARRTEERRVGEEWVRKRRSRGS